MKKKNTTKKKNKTSGKNIDDRLEYLRWLFFALALFLTLIIGLFWGIELVFAGKVAWGLKLGNNDLGGKTFAQIDKFFTQKLDLLKNGITISWGDDSKNYSLSEMGLYVDLDKCKQEVKYYAKQTDDLGRMYDRGKSLASGVEVRCDVWFDEYDYQKWLNDLKSQLDKGAVSAQINKTENNFEIQSAQIGQQIDSEALKKNIDRLLSGLENDYQVKLTFKDELPEITDEMAKKAVEIAREGINNGKLGIVHDDWNMDVDRDIVFDWYDFQLRSKDESENNNLPVNDQDQNLVVSFDLAKIDQFFDDNAYFEIRAEDARLQMAESGPIVVSEGSDGYMVNRFKFIEMLEDRVDNKNWGVVELPVEETKAVISADNINKLGIKELVATGESDFSWSPANRIHNIGVGAERFNGTVIAPGETFSFVERLGPVGAATGYLPELVIADNETRPEYGGGLCQVSTTMFRTAIYAGFPIVEREPHQYRVSYYEPAGMDSTIYIPHPDLKFINDTKNYILIESVLEGSVLKFNFYGTDDGRKVEVTQPNIYNITSPPAPVYIKTTSLAAGEQYQVDSAHYGADAVFYRTISYSNGEVKEEEFFSRYKAWPAKFKVGEGEVADQDDSDSPTDIDSENRTDNPESTETDLTTPAV